MQALLPPGLVAGPRVLDSSRGRAGANFPRDPHKPSNAVPAMPPPRSVARLLAAQEAVDQRAEEARRSHVRHLWDAIETASSDSDRSEQRAREAAERRRRRRQSGVLEAEAALDRCSRVMATLDGRTAPAEAIPVAPKRATVLRKPRSGRPSKQVAKPSVQFAPDAVGKKSAGTDTALDAGPRPINVDAQELESLLQHRLKHTGTCIATLVSLLQELQSYFELHHVLLPAGQAAQASKEQAVVAQLFRDSHRVLKAMAFGADGTLTESDSLTVATMLENRKLRASLWSQKQALSTRRAEEQAATQLRLELDDTQAKLRNLEAQLAASKAAHQSAEVRLSALAARHEERCRELHSTLERLSDSSAAQLARASELESLLESAREQAQHARDSSHFKESLLAAQSELGTLHEKLVQTHRDAAFWRAKYRQLEASATLERRVRVAASELEMDTGLPDDPLELGHLASVERGIDLQHVEREIASLRSSLNDLSTSVQSSGRSLLLGDNGTRA
eukprot:m.3312 g.3312  ORF g.3312 m.3312 type:complete len:507 (+) comp2294_c0_seq1:1810-3330(+)